MPARHDDPSDEARLRLFAGLYDGPEPTAPPPSVRLLNPVPSTDDDATVRRFALLEID